MKTEKLLRIIFLTTISLLVIGICGPLLYKSEQIGVYHACCNGNACSDTYYDFDTNTCHLVLCR